MSRKRIRLDSPDDKPRSDRERVKVKPKEMVASVAGPLPAIGVDRAKGKKRIPQRFTEAIEFALTMHGQDGKGKNGLPGYFYWMAQTDPKAMAHLIGRILPTKVQPSIDPQSVLGQVLESVRAKVAFERSKQIDGKVIK